MDQLQLNLTTEKPSNANKISKNANVKVPHLNLNKPSSKSTKSNPKLKKKADPNNSQKLS